MAGEDNEHLTPKTYPPLDMDNRELMEHHPILREEQDQQKINAMVNKVREVNDQLGGKVAMEIEFDEGPTGRVVSALAPYERGRSIFFFASTFRGMQYRGPSLVYGVDSQQGPIYVSGDLAARLLGGKPEAVSMDVQQVPTVTEDDVRNWLHPITSPADLNNWVRAFDESKNSVLQDQKEMLKLAEARSRTLDQALNVVSKPISLDAPPAPAPAPAAGPTSQGS